jgi:hypothetical protein
MVSGSPRLSSRRFLIGGFFLLLALALGASLLLLKAVQAPPTSRPTANLQRSSALPDFVGAVGTRLAALSYLPPTAPTPWPTPIQDLAMLVSQADAIAEARITGANGAMHSQMFYFEVETWFKKPRSVVTDTGVLWIPDPWEYIPDYGFRQMAVQTEGGDRFILLMTTNNTSRIGDMPDYYLAGSATGYFGSGFFQIGGKKIVSGGIPAYDQWSLDRFENELLKVQTPAPGP